MTDGSPRPQSGWHTWICGDCGGPKARYDSDRCRDCYEAERSARAETKRRAKGPAPRRWTPAEDAYLAEHYPIEPTGLIAAALGRTETSLYLRASARRLPSYQQAGRISARLDYFDRIDTPAKAYVLGLLLADGYITKLGQLCLALQEKDQSAVEFVRDEIAPAARLGGYIAVNEHSETPMVRFLIQAPRLRAAVARHGIVPAKSAIIGWPGEVPPPLEGSFLLGYFDGDGSLGHDGARPRWSVCCGSRRFLVEMQGHVRAALGFAPGGPYEDRDKNVWSVVATGGPARRLDEWTHQDISGLARKRLTA